MQVHEPVLEPWRANLQLAFHAEENRTVLGKRRLDGPLVVQKPLYPEGPGVCHAIVVHPPGGIAGGDELGVSLEAGEGAHVLATTPGAGKWYRSAGPWAKQSLRFRAKGILEWLPRETIVFDGAFACIESRISLENDARYIGWEVLCLGRTGSGERFGRGEIRIETELSRDGRLLWLERGRIRGERAQGSALMRSPAGLDGHTVFGTLVATLDAPDKGMVAKCREHAAVTLLPGVLLARYLGDSGEEAMRCFARLWALLRPALAGREATPPRIWST